jgi:hypothetical protein
MHSVNLIVQFFSKRIPVIAVLRQRALASDIHFIPRASVSIVNRFALNTCDRRVKSACVQHTHSTMICVESRLFRRRTIKKFSENVFVERSDEFVDEKNARSLRIESRFDRRDAFCARERARDVGRIRSSRDEEHV